MARVRRKALIAAMVGVIGMAAAVQAIGSSPASAQKNSRICGRIYKTTGGAISTETVVRIYEVRKLAAVAECDIATRSVGRHPGSPMDSPYQDKIVEKDLRFWTQGEKIEVDCKELFLKYLRHNRSDETSKNDGWSVGGMITDGLQDDICKYMNRSDNVGEMNAYFLYNNEKDTNNYWEFQQH